MLRNLHSIILIASVGALVPGLDYLHTLAASRSFPKEGTGRNGAQHRKKRDTSTIFCLFGGERLLR